MASVRARLFPATKDVAVVLNAVAAFVVAGTEPEATVPPEVRTNPPKKVPMQVR